mmetsp:Transcript_63559/g.165003  ORF Transcript_63559/g.165003 Transcript_63559/m.165003 type:complete len:810 (-) Transcript_63559:158-2587(-)
MDPIQLAPPSSDSLSEEYRARAKEGGAAARACTALTEAENLLEQEELHRALTTSKESLKGFKDAGSAGCVADAARLVAKILATQGKWEEAYKVAQEELTNCRRSGDKQGEATMLLTVADVKWPAGDHEEALRAAEEAQAIFREVTSPKGSKMQALALMTLAWVHLTSDADKEGSVSRAVTAAKRAIVLCQEVSYKKGEAEAAHIRAVALASDGAFGECLRSADEALDLFLEIKDKRRAAIEWLCMSQWHLNMKNPGKAVADAEDALEAIQSIGLAHREPTALLALFRAYEAQGKPKKAGRTVKQSLARFEDSGNKLATAEVLGVLFQVYKAAGKPRDALNAAEQAVSLFRQLNEPGLESKQLGAISALHFSTGAHDKALEAGKAALPLVKQAGTSDAKIELMNALAESYAALLDSRAAMEVAKEMQQHFQDIEDNEGCAAALMTMCSLAMKEENYEEAARAAANAQAIFNEEEDAKGEANALRLLAEVHSRKEEHKAALRAAEQARVLFQDLEDPVGEAMVLYLLAQNAVLLTIREGARVKDNARASKTSREALAKASKTVNVAVQQARDLEEKGHQLLACSLCTLSQVMMLSGRSSDALTAADEGIALFRDAGDTASEAAALLLSADALRDLASYRDSQEAANEALRLYKEGDDEKGQERAQELLDHLQEYLRPVARAPVPSAQAAIAAPLQQVDFSQQGGQEQGAAAPRQATSVAKAKGPALDLANMNEETVKARVMEIAIRVTGAEDDELEADTPLMEAGLTSNSAILLRDELSAELPGVNLPVTLVFDYPTIADMSELIVESINK